MYNRANARNRSLFNRRGLLGLGPTTELLGPGTVRRLLWKSVRPVTVIIIRPQGRERSKVCVPSKYQQYLLDFLTLPRDPVHFRAAARWCRQIPSNPVRRRTSHRFGVFSERFILVFWTGPRWRNQKRFCGFRFFQRSMNYIEKGPIVARLKSTKITVSERPHVQAWLNWTEQGTLNPQVGGLILSKPRKLKFPWIWTTQTLNQEY